MVGTNLLGLHHTKGALDFEAECKPTKDWKAQAEPDVDWKKLFTDNVKGEPQEGFKLAIPNLPQMPEPALLKPETPNAPGIPKILDILT